MMPIPVHVICGKCGSLDIKFEIGDPEPDEGFCGVSTYCANCSELTSIEEINNWKKDE